MSENDVKVIKSMDALVPLDIHHNQVYLELNGKISNNIKRIKNKFDFKKANYSVINTKLSGTDWDNVLIDHNIDHCAELFRSVLNNLIISHVPLKGESKDIYPTWYSEDLICKIINKKNMHKQWLEFGVMQNYISFRKLDFVY